MSELHSHYWQGKSLVIHYLSAGDPGRPVVLFFHGFLGTGFDWHQIIAHLSANYYCIAPDLPGHGKTIIDPPQRKIDWQELGNIFFDFITAIARHGKVTGAGYSMGGRMVLYLAATFPALFHRLIVESASPGLKTAAERKKRFRHDLALAEKLAGSDLDKFLQEWYQQPLFHSLSGQAVYEELLKQREKENPAQLAAALRLMSSGIQPSLWPRLRNLNLPLLLLAGKADKKYVRILTEMQIKCPNAQLKIINNAGHNTHLENPLVFLEYMSNFLTQTREIH